MGGVGVGIAAGRAAVNRRKERGDVWEQIGVGTGVVTSVGLCVTVCVVARWDQV